MSAMVASCVLGERFFPAVSVSHFSTERSPFVSTISHDFRSGFSRMISKEPAKKPSSLKLSYKNGRGIAVASNLSHKELVLKQARLQFRDQVAFRKQDCEISLAKALLLISAEDEAFMSLNREKDRVAVQSEGRNSSVLHSESCGAGVDAFLIAGKTMSMWVSRFDFLAKEVEDMLALKGGIPKPIEVLRAVSTVLFDIQGFKLASTDLESGNSYLHLVLTLGSGTGILLCIIYIEVCKRLGIPIKGIDVGDEVLIWPLVESLQECFVPYKGGKSWFSKLLAVLHQPHLLSGITGDLTLVSNSNSPSLTFTSNRDIVAKALINLKKLHWKGACKSRPGFGLTDPLHPLVYADGRLVDHSELAVGALLRPQSLRLAIMASERLLLLQPDNWEWRRDHGLLLYHSRRYGEAVQELSICTAFAPTIEAHMLEHFVEKLHLLRAESSWSSVRSPSAPSTLA